MQLDQWKLKARMVEAKVETYTELAALIGVPKQSVSRWINGGSFNNEQLGALCRVLACTPNDILKLELAPA